MERVVSEVFSGFGYEVYLTPSSNDGGKDVVVSKVVSGVRRTYLIEVKHWKSGKKVGRRILQDFQKVIVREQSTGGLVLASGGFSRTAFEFVTEIERKVIALGGKRKIASLCQMYKKAKDGIWRPELSIDTIIFGNSLIELGDS